MKKYEFTGKPVYYFGRVLHRIRAVRDFDGVEAGGLGGFIESEQNLSHEGNAWVCEDALVFGDAMVCGDALVCDNARVFGNALVFGDAEVFGYARVSGDAKVFDNARVSGDAQVSGNARVSGDAQVSGNAWVEGDALISTTRDYLIVGPLGSRDGCTTFYKTASGGISVTCGCFYGTIDEFQSAVQKEHGDNRYAKEYNAAIELAKIHFEA